MESRGTKAWDSEILLALFLSHSACTIVRLCVGVDIGALGVEGRWSSTCAFVCVIVVAFAGIVFKFLPFTVQTKVKIPISVDRQTL